MGTWADLLQLFPSCSSPFNAALEEWVSVSKSESWGGAKEKAEHGGQAFGDV